MKPQMLFNDHAEVAAFVFSQIPYGPTLADIKKDWYRSLGVVRRGRLIGGVVWHDKQLNTGDVQMSCAGKGAWITKEVALTINAMPFLAFGVAHCTARHAASNTQATQLHISTGWKLEGRQRLAYDSKEDALLFGMTLEDCRSWYNKAF